MGAVKSGEAARWKVLCINERELLVLNQNHSVFSEELEAMLLIDPLVMLMPTLYHRRAAVL